MDFVKKMLTGAWISAILYVVFGLLFILLPGLTMRTICYLLALALGIVGIWNIAGFFRASATQNSSNGLARGIILLLCALFLMLKSELVISIIPVVLGFGVVVSGVMKLQNAVSLYKIKSKSWIAVLVTALLCLILGVVLIENPFTAASTLMIFIGIGLLFSGLTDLGILFSGTRRK